MSRPRGVGSTNAAIEKAINNALQLRLIGELLDRKQQDRAGARPTQKPKGPSEMRSIELFAGCGGLALGLKRAGWSAQFAIERDPMAFETLSKNMIEKGAPYLSFEKWPSWLPKSHLDLVTLLHDSGIRKRLISLRGKIDLVAGGPPCQGFSVGGRRDGEDVRNTLVYSMLDFVRLVEPKAVLIENVEGIVRKFISKPGQANSSVADHVIEILHEMGYSATFHVVDASNFGVPQSRRRVVIIAVRGSKLSELRLNEIAAEALKDAATDVRHRNGLPLNRRITVREAIEDLAGSKRIPCPDSRGFDAGTYKRASSSYAKLMRAGLSHDAVPNSHRYSKHGERVQALYELAHSTQSKGRLSKDFLLQAGTKKDKKVLIDPDDVVSTITTHPDEFIHYAYPRNVTVREMARLQSFPDQFEFHGRYTINGPRRKFDVARCSQVGNAVPPLLGEGIGIAIKRILETVKSAETVTSSKALASALVSMSAI
jgi:DNA (cytosine-5)-methyltransferase 1